MKPRWRIRKHREWWVVEDMQMKIVCYGSTWRAAINWLEEKLGKASARAI